METYKTIFSGRLEFGSIRSFEKVVRLFEHRAENYYRNAIIIKAEEVFDEATFSLDIPRLIVQSTTKEWRNTINLLEYLADYAIAGNLKGWMTDQGKIREERFIEPDCDKVAVQAYLQGRELIDQTGKEAEAKKALSRAIEKFERHALAYERRGHVNFQLHNFKDALYDYTKSIDINPNNPEPYVGRAFVHLRNQDYAKAIKDLDQATKTSIPHQPIYWKARRLKGECHFKLQEFDKAAFEFKLFSGRKFNPENSNYKWRQRTWSLYGQTLIELKEYSKAIDAFNESLSIAKNQETAVEAEELMLRGIARQKAGESGFERDWEKAAGLGSQKAAELLASYA
ncbi:MAG: tetratricopeptide repeat protein [Phaeodactylibacter sp.]|nr:tetratricopeptide repeat protein [Phaeodactylibacter sp.]